MQIANVGNWKITHSNCKHLNKHNYKILCHLYYLSFLSISPIPPLPPYIDFTKSCSYTEIKATVNILKFVQNDNTLLPPLELEVSIIGCE